MSPETSRRTFVRICALGGAGAVGAAGSLAGATSDAGADARSVGPATGSRPTPAQDDPEATVERLREELRRRREEHREALSTLSSETKQRAQAVGLDARESVVVLNPTQGRLGTAWAVDDSHLLTNAHNVSRPGQKVEYWSLDGERFDGEVVDLVDDQQPDVGLIETDRTLSPLDTRTTDSLDRDDTIVQVGHPGNFGYWVLAAGPYLDQQQSHSFASEVPILIGNSGSPVLDLEGRVVGISSSATIDPAQQEAWGEPFRDETVLHKPVRPEITTYHVPIEAALDRVERWT